MPQPPPRLVRPDHCEECLEECRPEPALADYLQPFDVLWLCGQCRYEWNGDRPGTTLGTVPWRGSRGLPKAAPTDYFMRLRWTMGSDHSKDGRTARDRALVAHLLRERGVTLSVVASLMDGRAESTVSEIADRGSKLHPEPLLEQALDEWIRQLAARRP